MQLAHVLLICILLLFAGDALGGYCALMKVRKFTVFYVVFVALVLQAFPIVIVPEFRVNPGYLVLLTYAMYLCLMRHGALAWLVGIGMSGALGFIMFMLVRMEQPMAHLDLILGAIGGMGALFLLKFPAISPLVACLSPLLLSLYQVGFDLYAFGYTVYALGMDLAFDAAVAALVVGGLIHFAYEGVHLMRAKT